MLNRRKFLVNTSITSLAIPVAAFASFSLPNSPIDDFELNEISIDALQQKMESGELSSRSITEAYLKRIKQIDKEGPKLNAIMEINPDALAIADQMDGERKAGKTRGPMHGIPVLIKDNTDSGDQMMTTAGSIALLGHKAKQDAFIVKQLRKAGAVLLGKTNLSEWSNYRGSWSVSGWSSRGGLTRNPYILDRNASGSSSGSGVGVAANLCAVAIGTETDGSIISPASHNGVVGIKPTVGLLSRSGIIPISKTQDTAGPIARTVTDAAIFLGVLTGIDEEDATTKESIGKAHTNYTKYLNPDGLKGKRIGVEKSALEGRPNIIALFREAIQILKKNGATIIEVELMKQFEKFGKAERSILDYEFKDGINRYLSKADTSMRSLADIIEFNNQHADKVMPYFKQEIMERCQRLGNLQSKEYLDALKQRLGARKMITEMMSSQKLDALCGITAGVPDLIDLVNGDVGSGHYFGSPAAVTGFPHITVPMGTVGDLPAGISFMAGPYKEPELISIAYAYEQASKKRTPPRFILSSLSA